MSDDPVGGICAELGEDRVRAIVARFYARIRSDDLLAPLYPDDDWEGAEERLADFLVMRFGGSQRYAETRGHPRLRMRHAPFAIGQRERDRWVELMDRAIDGAELDPAPRDLMRRFLHDVATFLMNR